MRNSDRPIRDSLIRLIGRRGLHVTDRTPADEVRGLIARLHPLRGGRELIRLGPDGDGGYLLPDDLVGIDYAFSPGVSNESGFEAALAARGIQVFLADHSVDGPREPNARFTFTKKHVGCLSDDTYMTLAEWKDNSIQGHSSDLLMQMDIEAGEYETLLAAPDALLAQFRILIIEFHYLHELFNRRFFDLAARTFARILRTHSVVHIHPNNCCGSVRSEGLEIPRIAEFTFHRNDRLGDATPAGVFPHPLDRNNTRKATLVLPRCWYA